MPEIRRLLARLVFSALPDAPHVLRWSRWRRHHQHRAKLCHYRTRGHDPTKN